MFPIKSTHHTLKWLSASILCLLSGKKRAGKSAPNQNLAFLLLRCNVVILWAIKTQDHVISGLINKPKLVGIYMEKASIMNRKDAIKNVFKKLGCDIHTV